MALAMESGSLFESHCERFDLPLDDLVDGGMRLLEHGGGSSSARDEEGESEEVSDGKQSRLRKGRFSKNLLSERRRRQKLNEKLYSLRAIVPKISKMDKASIMADAAAYVQELQQQVKEMRRQVEDNTGSNGPFASPKHSPVSEVIDPDSVSPLPVKSRLQVDVQRLDDPETCMFRFTCCATSMPLLAGVLESLNVQIVSGSFATFGGQLFSSYITRVRDKELMDKETLESVICNALEPDCRVPSWNH